MTAELRVKYLEFRRQLFSAGSELAAERIRRQAYAYLLNEIKCCRVPDIEIGELCHQFLYLEEVDRQVHGAGWVDFGVPMLCPGKFGTLTFLRAGPLSGDESGDDFYELRFFDVNGEEMRYERGVPFGGAAEAVDAAQYLLRKREALNEYVGQDEAHRVAVVAVTVHGKFYASGHPIFEGACVWYSDLSVFVRKV